ncbi:MAG: hypothetical protein ABH883_00500 [Candidatus Omnitrophota bacterium]
MLRSVRRSVGIVVLLSYVLTSAGCAAAWFLAGAGTAVASVAMAKGDKKENKK